MRIIAGIFVFVVVFTPVLIASPENVLPFAEFYIKSNGIEDSGEIIVNGKKDNRGFFTSLSVNVFDNVVVVPKEILQQISRQAQNSIQITYSNKKNAIAGKIIYLQFDSSVSGKSRRSVKIAIFENGNVQIVER